MNGDITLTEDQILFLMLMFRTRDPDQAIELFVESLVLAGHDPMKLKDHLNIMIARVNN